VLRNSQRQRFRKRTAIAVRAERWQAPWQPVKRARAQANNLFEFRRPEFLQRYWLEKREVQKETNIGAMNY